MIRRSGRGVFYSDRRVGRDGKIFYCHKFRTMVPNANKLLADLLQKDPELRREWEIGFKLKKDPRVTAIGRFLRKTSLDELPQLFNVLKGEMSLVGPRPERPYFVEQLKQEIPYYSVRHSIKPGVTGWAQVKYQYGSTVEDAMEKLRYDLYYIKHLSIVFDLTIVLDTVKVILFGKGAK